MLVYVSACMHSSMDAFLHACVCVCLCVSQSLSQSACMYLCTKFMCACMHACMYLILFQCAYIYMCICVCVCMYVHTHTLSGTASNAFTCHCSSKKLSQDHNMLTTGGKKSKDRKDFRRWVASCRRKQDAGFMCILTQLARSSCYA